ncbi:MAG: hypothetical protein JWL59_1367 [Chthoniobacteraceae bacterium]|nr:hypothetical protein [Chthoniobacteraceae bacterium]
MAGGVSRSHTGGAREGSAPGTNLFEAKTGKERFWPANADLLQAELFKRLVEVAEMDVERAKLVDFLP